MIYQIILENFWILLLIFILAIDKRYRVGAITIILIECMINCYNHNMFIWIIIAIILFIILYLCYPRDNNDTNE